MTVVLDRIYITALIAFVTSCAINIRIAVERPRLVRQTAGYLHVIACVVGGTGALIMAMNEIFGWGLCKQLHFGCASGHVAKILGHVINFMRLDSVSRFNNPVRIGFGVLMLAKAAAAGCHCSFFTPVFIPQENLCFPALEIRSTNTTYGMEVLIDVVFAGLFVFKLYQHIDQFRGMGRRASSALQPMYRQFMWEVIPFLIVSMAMNSFILSGHFGPYSICFIYFDFAFSVRVTNDLVYLGRLSRPDNIWADGNFASKFNGDGPGVSTISSSIPARSDPRHIVATVDTTTIHDSKPAYWNEEATVGSVNYYPQQSQQQPQHIPMGDLHPNR